LPDPNAEIKSKMAPLAAAINEVQAAKEVEMAEKRKKKMTQQQKRKQLKQRKQDEDDDELRRKDAQTGQRKN
jgi:hypothetical protein